MRKDMDKVLVTTPRVGSSWRNGEVRANRRVEREGKYDDLPSYSSMKPKSGSWDRKSLNEYLNPLVRYLAKNCDRPWDKVYSEICENMDRRGAVQDHIFQHLFDYVELHPIIENGRPHSTGYKGLYRLYKNGWTFYVNKYGLLKEPRERPARWRRGEDNPNLIKTEDTSVFFIRRVSDGTWFEASLEDRSDVEDLAYSHSNSDWVVETMGDFLIKGRHVRIKTISKKKKKTLGIM